MQLLAALLATAAATVAAACDFPTATANAVPTADAAAAAAAASCPRCRRRLSRIPESTVMPQLRSSLKITNLVVCDFS